MEHYEKSRSLFVASIFLSGFGFSSDFLSSNQELILRTKNQIGWNMQFCHFFRCVVACRLSLDCVFVRNWLALPEQCHCSVKTNKHWLKNDTSLWILTMFVTSICLIFCLHKFLFWLAILQLGALQTKSPKSNWWNR